MHLPAAPKNNRPSGGEIQNQLLQFTRVLRGLGIRVSTAEVLDAARALTLVDVTRRDEFKVALRSMLVKDQADRKLFDLAFERFFLPPELREQIHREEKRAQQEQEKATEEAVQELAESVKESGGRWAGNAPNRLQLTPEQKETLARMPAAERKRLREIIERFEGNPVNDPSFLIAEVVEASLNYWRYYLSKQEESRSPARGRGLRVSYTGQEEVDEVVRYVAEKYARETEETCLHQDMQNIAQEDLPRVTALIDRLSRNLANRLSRRYRRSSIKKRLDIRRTVRGSISCGGVPFRLAYRSRRVKRPKLVVICDVSASMVRYARFIVQFIFGIASVVRDVEAFIFAEDLERITPYLKGGGSFAGTMSTIMSESLQWGKTTNLNTALATLKKDYSHLMTPDTYFLIVSDTKTQQAGEATKRLEKIKPRVKELIWLNTLPAPEWEKVFTVPLFRELARMYECGTVAQLEGILQKHLV